MRLLDSQDYFSAVLPVYAQIQVPQTRAKGWEALKELSKDQRYNPLVWMISDVIKARQMGILKHVEVIVYGPPGAGKTTYVVNSLLWIFEDPKEVLKRIIFDMDGMTEFVRNVVNGVEYDVAVFDDPTAVGLSSSYTLKGKKEKQRIANIIDAFTYIKDYVGVVIYTVPRLVGLAKFIRDIAEWKVKVKKDGKIIFTRSEIVSTRSGLLKEVDVPHMFYFQHETKMPDEIWKTMMERRKKVVADRLLRALEGGDGEVTESDAGDE